jgi:uncharacterized protein YndB with AHSA1/START domain
VNGEGTLTVRDDGTHVVSFERFIERPVAIVWTALTDPTVLRNWIGELEIEPKVGGKYVIHFRESVSVMIGRIVTFEVERLLEYSWLENFGMPESYVRWELAPQGDGCSLKLTHTVPAEASKSDVVGLLGGWHDFLDSLPDGADGRFMPYGNKPSEKAIEALYRGKYLEHESNLAMSSRVLAVRFVRMLPGPIDRVWRHLTETALLPSWFGTGTIEGRPGGAVSLMDGHIRGVVTQWHPPHRLAYSWNVFNPGDAPDAKSPYPESYLSFTLDSAGGDVRLTLSHMPILDRFEKQNAMGWHTFLDILAATVRGEKVEDRPFYSAKNAARYGVDLNKLAR